MKLLAFALPLLFPWLAQAYLPPAYHIYAEVAAHRGKGAMFGAAFTVSRPLPSGGEEVIGSVTVPGPMIGSGNWPLLSLLFQAEEAPLLEAVRGFGLSIAKETDLLRASRDQVAAMKEAPRPFYKTDPLVSLKRFNKTYAWVHADKEGARGIWVEKDTFLPLRVEAPCPPVDLSWTKSGDNRCAVEFRNIYALRRGNSAGARIILLKDGMPAMYFSFDRLLPATNGNVVLNGEAKYPEEIKALSAILFR